MRYFQEDFYISDPRGFSYTITFERFNNVVANVNTSEDEYIIDVHLKALRKYHNYLLLSVVSRKRMEMLTRELFSIGWLRWNLTKIFRRFQKKVISISTTKNNIGRLWNCLKR